MRDKQEEEQEGRKRRKLVNKIEILCWVFLSLIKFSETYRFTNRIAKGCSSVSLLHSSALFFSGTCSYTSCTDGHFEPVPSLAKMYYSNSSYQCMHILE